MAYFTRNRGPTCCEVFHQCHFSNGFKNAHVIWCLAKQGTAWLLTELKVTHLFPTSHPRPSPPHLLFSSSPPQYELVLTFQLPVFAVFRLSSVSFSSSRSNLRWHLHTPQAPEPLRASTHEHPYILPLWMCGSQVDVRFIVSGVRHTVMKHVVVLEHRRSTLEVRCLVPFNDSGGVTGRNQISRMPQCMPLSFSLFLCTEHLLSRTTPPPSPSTLLRLAKCA